MRATAHAALGKTVSHCLKAKFVVITMAHLAFAEGERNAGDAGRKASQSATYPNARGTKHEEGFFEPEMLHGDLPHLPPSLRPVIEFAFITGWRPPRRRSEAAHGLTGTEKGQSGSVSTATGLKLLNKFGGAARI